MKFVKNSILFLSIILMLTAFAAAQDKFGAKGRVCNIYNRGIAAVNVTAIQDGKEIKSAITDRKGEFVFEGLKAGKYDFTFKKDGFNSGALKNVELGDKEKFRDLGRGLVLEVDDGSLVIIRGLVFDEEGRSIPGVQVLIERVIGTDNFQKVKIVSTNSGEDAGERGEFIFKLPENGSVKYRITATFKGKSASKELSVESAAVYRTAITLNLQNN